MIGIIIDILDVASALFGMRKDLAEADKQKQEEMATYFKAVSECLAATYDKLLEDEVPHGRCAELLQYARSLPRVVEGYVDRDKAEELSEMLARSHEVEGLWEQFNTDPEKKNELPSIAAASGMFLALSNTIRAGQKP